MSEFANTTCFVISGGVVEVPVGATGTDKYLTDVVAAPILGDLARLKYIEAVFRGEIALDIAEACEMEISLLGDGVSLGMVTMNTTAAKKHWAFNLGEINMSALTGSSKLTIKVDVNTAAGTVANFARISGLVDVTHPIIIS